MGKISLTWLAVVGMVALAEPAAADALDQDTAEMVATMLNLNGFLCAKVTDFRKLEVADQYEVTCVEYRGGSGTVRYILDLSTGKAFKA
jgi:hypothetical protein